MLEDSRRGGLSMLDDDSDNIIEADDSSVVVVACNKARSDIHVLQRLNPLIPDVVALELLMCRCCIRSRE